MPKLAAIFLGTDVAAGGAAGANRLVAREEPDALLVKEVVVQERADRAKIDDVAGERVVERVAGKDVDLRVAAATHHHQFIRSGDLAGEPDAAGTHDAAVLVQLNRLRNLLPRFDHPFLNEAMGRLAVIEAVVLEATLAGLVADGAIERVIGQEILHYHSLIFFDLGAVRDDDGPVLGRRLAAGDESGDHFDLAGFGIFRAGFDLAHSAVGDDRERGVPAMSRGFRPRRGARPGSR